VADDPGKTSAPCLTLKQAAESAKKRRDAALRRVRQNDPASIEAVQRANADYTAAHDRLVNSMIPNAKEEIAQLEKRRARRSR
jgi:hypothetical protein